MRRREDWQERLSALIERASSRQHRFGEWDCLLWPAAAVKAVTGRDFARGHRGRYRSQASAYRYLGQAFGVASPAELLDRLFAHLEIGFAQRGDLVLCRTAEGDNPGVVVGGDALVVGEKGELSGLIPVPRRDWIRAWRVGDE